MKRGLFITFEGGEGAGKSTLIEGVFQCLSHRFSVVKTREPGGTFLAEEIRNLLLKKRQEAVSPYAELALFLASRAQHVQELILPALNAGKIVLCDRFNDSSVAYQGIARSLGKKQVQDVCQFFSDNLRPDLTFYLDIEPRIGLQRVQTTRVKDRIEDEGLLFHEKIRNAYLEIASDNPERVKIISALKSKEDVLSLALDTINPLLQNL